jgi:hypothetical protein
MFETDPPGVIEGIGLIVAVVLTVGGGIQVFAWLNRLRGKTRLPYDAVCDGPINDRLRD